MTKKLESAVDKIIELYMQGFSAKVAIDAVIETLNLEEQYELIKLLQVVGNKEDEGCK